MMVDSLPQGCSVSRALLFPPGSTLSIPCDPRDPSRRQERDSRSPSKESLSSSDSGRSSLGYASDSDFRGEDLEAETKTERQQHLSLNSLPDFKKTSYSGCYSSRNNDSSFASSSSLPGLTGPHGDSADPDREGNRSARTYNWRPLISDIREENSPTNSLCSDELDSGPESLRLADVFEEVSSDQPTPTFDKRRRRAVTRISANSDTIKSSFTRRVTTPCGVCQDIDMRLRFTDIVESDNDDDHDRHEGHEGAWWQPPRPPIINVEFTDYQDTVLSDISDNDSCPNSRCGSRRSSLLSLN